MATHKIHVMVLMKDGGIEEEYFVKQHERDSEKFIESTFEGLLGSRFKSDIFDAMYYGKQNCGDGFTLLHHSWRIN